MKNLLLSALFALTATAAAAQDLPGYDRLDVHAPHRANLIAASVWYPAGQTTYVVPIGDNALFEGRPALMGADIAEGRFPLVLLSHGSGGNMDGMAWLSSELVKRGAMVLAVNHPGSTSGDSSPRRSMQIGNRARDLIAALDQVMANPDFAPHVDPSRISVLGFSLGGTTALGLAGLRLDPTAMPTLCKDFDGIGDGCEFYDKGGVDFARLPDDFGADIRDPRISRTIAVDPGFTGFATSESVAATEEPVLLINLGAPETLWEMTDVGPEGTDLASRLPNATRQVIAPADHFTFLMECKPGASEILAEEGADPICDDPEGTDRAAAHAQIADQVAAFLDL